MSESPPKRASLGLALTLLAFVLGCRLLALRSCPLYDDAFITYRYARNLAEGHGLVYNPGAEWEPVLGTTTPGYALLLGLAGSLGLSIPGTSLVLNLLFDLGSAALLLRLCAGRRLVQVTAVALFAGLPHIARISVGGMEAPLFGLLALATAALIEGRRPGWAGWAAALACTVRPEGVLFVALGGLALARRPRELVRFALPVAAVGAVAIAALTAVYGSPIPQSVTAKRETLTAAGGTAWRRVGEILQQAFLPSLSYGPLLPFVAMGFAHGLRERGATRLVLAFGLAITGAYVAARPHSWGWYYFVPLTAWCLACGLGVERVAQGLGLEARLSALADGLLPPLGLGLLLVLGAVVTGRRPDRITSEVYGPVHDFAASHGLDAPSVEVVASDIGVLGWAARARVLDSEGLVWPGALEVHRRTRDAHEAQMAIALERRPEWVVLVVERGRVAAAERADLRALYEPVARFNALGEGELEPPSETVPWPWRQDYLFLRRRE